MVCWAFWVFRFVGVNQQVENLSPSWGAIKCEPDSGSTHFLAKKTEKIPTWFNGRNGPLRNLQESSRHWTKSKPEDLYGSLAPTDDDIDEELNLMGTYL